MLTNIEQKAVWGAHAQQWSRVGPPLKPSPEDGSLTLEALRALFERDPKPCRLAILGVTPELVQLPWPVSAELLAFDHSASMIAKVWQPHVAVKSSVREANWRELPLESGGIGAVVGDGSLNVLPSLGDYAEVLRELHRVLAPQGLGVVRCFIRPEERETVEEVTAAVQSGQVGSFHALKWRLAMSLVDVPGASVAVTDIHAAFEACFPSRARLASITGWPEPQIDTIDAYKGSATRYNFPTLQEMRAHCAPYFDVEDIRYATYELADRCPTLTLRRRDLVEAQA